MRSLLLRAAALVTAFAAAGCFQREVPLPRPVGIAPLPLPTITPIPAPDPICIGRMSPGQSAAEPRKAVHVAPELPPLRTRGRRFGIRWSGVAVIAPDGSVGAVRTIPSSPGVPPEWEAAIVAAIRQWRYEPVCENGHPIGTELRLTVSIHI